MRDRYVHKAFLAAGLDHLRFHDYRRSFKTRAEQAGIPVGLRAAYTGHGLEMDARYTVHQRHDLESVLRKMEPGHFGDMEGGNG
jgi:integrase